MASISEKPDNPLDTVGRVAVKGGRDWRLENIQELAHKLQNHELAFIEDRETIDLVKNQRKKPEMEFYRKYIKDQHLRLQIEMGFCLRYLENESEKLHDLRGKILRKYGEPGLHVAEFVNCGIFTKYASLVLGDTKDNQELEKRLNDFLKNIDKYVLFVKVTDEIKICSDLVVSRIYSNAPEVFIIFSKGPGAIKKADQILDNVRKRIRDYSIQTIVEYSGSQKYHFILKSQLEIPLVAFITKKPAKKILRKRKGK